MIIGVDLDDVLVDFVGGLAEYHNHQYGTSFTRDDFFSFSFYKVWGGTKDQAIEKVRDFYDTEFFDDLKPIYGAIAGVEELSKNHRLKVVTSRPEFIKDKSLNHVNKYFPNKFEEVYFAKNSYMTPHKGKEKLEFCLHENIAVLIEDALTHASRFDYNGTTKMFLYDSPWNKTNLLPINVERVKSWEEVVEKINSF